LAGLRPSSERSFTSVGRPIALSFASLPCATPLPCAN
jgi:hypothetical protein